MTLKYTKWLTVTCTFLLCALIIYLLQQRLLTNPELLQLYLKRLGWTAPLGFILIQIIQVVIPVIPGGISSAIGIIFFGPMLGFVYNYVGLLIGSYIVFKLVKLYGKSFILKVTDEKTYDKYIGWLDQGRKFEIFFSIAILLPGFPDDLLCMIAGLTNMSMKKYMLINILCKPVGLFFYSYGIKELMSYIGHFF
ncbi:TVP38/TMEM64 family protein [[Clostridium] spiroforme]|nr:TVP38/TMEM64 family protein [Thomasclavelia spiroformis]MBM6880554.1 TVP38/TMEM64 family protein [Thomasclavelia spiroformis]MBM6929605.1 TVP38/TMEM64 family protein [Thomasclavelia spiroformis]